MHQLDKYGRLSALVEAEGYGPLPVNDIDDPASLREDSLELVGELVLDRILFRPGETLRVTGADSNNAFKWLLLLLATACFE
jgi:hypothetical protein